MNELDIANYLLKDVCTRKYFKGVMAYDELPNKPLRPALYVVNTDKSTGVGKHWVCLFFSHVNEYFDSLGNPPVELGHFLLNEKRDYMYNSKRLQGPMSDVCGDYCILFAYFRCRGLSMKHFVDMFSSNETKNDTLVKL